MVLQNESMHVFFKRVQAEAYGDPTEHPQKEGYWGNVNPIGIRSCYDEGKRALQKRFLWITTVKIRWIFVSFES